MNVSFAEYNVLYLGLSFCMDKEFLQVGNKMDSQLFAALLNANGLSGWLLCNVIHRIKGSFSQVCGRVNHIYWKINSVADSLASLSLQDQHIFTSKSQLPTKVHFLIRLDSQSLPYFQLFYAKV